MSELTTRDATGNFIAADSNRAKAFIWNNEFENGTLLNASGAQKLFEIGTVLGRIAASGKLVPLASAAVDGSALPVGILAQDVTLGIAGEDTVAYCIAGSVNAAAIILDGVDTLSTVVALKTIGDRIKGDTKGIKLETINDSTFYDN